MLSLNKQEKVASLLGIVVLIGTIIVIMISLAHNNIQKAFPSPTPTPLSTLHAIPLLKYNEGKSKELLNKLENRQPLTSNDNAVRQKLINSLNGNSGDLQITSDYDIQYLSSPDQFQAEILTTNISFAKQEVVKWFIAQGMSLEGICKLPLSFFVNHNIAQQLSGQNIQFNPLPDNCQ